MQLRLILSAMRHNKAGALLIATQMAVTLAFLANSLTIIEHRLAWSSRPTGIDEANVFFLLTENTAPVQDLAARQTTDLDALRGLSGVLDAFATNDYPLQGGGWSLSVNLTATQKSPSGTTGYYFSDEHGLNSFGLKLIAGRNFHADEIVNRTGEDAPAISGYIVTRDLADKLFPAGDALGQSVFVESTTKSVPIIGIVERLETPFTDVNGAASDFSEDSMLAPYRDISDSNTFVVRGAPGQRAAVMKAAAAALARIDPSRIIRSQTMTEVRADAYRGARGLIVLLCCICASLLIVTAFGIVGLTSYWVAQRRQQIGIRRALGATKGAILRYFQTENIVISSVGAAAGVALAIALNLWMMSSFQMVRMDNALVVGGAILMLLLGQLAVLWPALRAASIPPALATRGG